MKGRPTWLTVRDVLLTAGGLVGVMHEEWWPGMVSRPDLLVLYAAMMGLPAFLEGDRRRRNKDSEEQEKD